MIKRITKITFFIITIIAAFFILTNSAIAYSSGTKSINERISQMDIKGLEFSSIYYSNCSNTSSKDFGLEGLVYNTNNYDCSFDSTAIYYDSSYNIVDITHNNQTVPAGDSELFNQMSSSLEINSGYSADDIAYYKLEIEVIYNNNVLNDYTDTNNYTEIDNYTYTDTNRTGNGEYAITKYNIDMTVNENNTFDMNERITAYFNIDKHGIFRSLPMKNTIRRNDGTSSTNRARITNVEVNNDFTTYKSNGDYVIKIGSPNYTYTGEHFYKVNYNYNIGKDPNKNFDELYYNLIGPEWETTISNFTFTITMPKEFDKSKLGFSLGSIGSTDSTDIKYTVDGNVITGSCDRVIKAGESLTVRMELPEGYFVVTDNGVEKIIKYLIFIIPIIFVIISYLIWRKYGKDDQVVETVEFYPPEGLNSLEAGYLYKGKPDNQDVVSLLIYLANKGYIKISEIDENNGLSKNKGFKITKIKEYDGDNIDEKTFLNGLFTKKESNNTASEVTSTDLYDNFYITMGKIIENVTKKYKEKIFEKNKSGKTALIMIMIIATFCLITITPMILFDDPMLTMFGLMFPGIGLIIMLPALFIDTKHSVIKSPVLLKIFGIIFGAMMGGIPWAVVVLPDLVIDKVYLYGYIFGIICIVAMYACAKYLPKRTPYGNQMLGKLRGFKNFLETAEKQKLEELVMQDPQYFYNILPYTYVLGVSDKWISKFETIGLQAPNWCDTGTTFSTTSFRTFMDSTMTSASSTMSSSPSSSGGGSSGGGSSGGGSGGGGGGSW